MLRRCRAAALMVWISRQQQLGQAPRNRDERDRQLLGQYLRLVEGHYREHLSVEEIEALGREGLVVS